jgi:hypothetical protein
MRTLAAYIGVLSNMSRDCATTVADGGVARLGKPKRGGMRSVQSSWLAGVLRRGEELQEAICK